MRKVIVLLLTAVLLGSGFMLIRSLLDYREGEVVYGEAEELVRLPDFTEIPELPETPDIPETPEVQSPAASSAAEETPNEEKPRPVYIDPYADALRNMDFSALREVNPEVLGWILIPNTAVSYPLLQHSDNQYYLKRNWKTWGSAVGSIFMECNNRSDFSQFNTILYGHNMNNGSMFGTLKRYKSQSYWQQHPRIYITTDAGSRCYEIFAAYEVSTEGETYRIGFTDEAEKQAFLDFCMGASVIQTGVIPTTADQILTLSTCTGRGHATRWVVQGVLKASVPAEPEVTEEPAPQPDAPAVPESPAEEMPAEPALSQEIPLEEQEPGETEPSESSEPEEPAA